MYGNDVNMLGENINAEALLAAGKKAGLEANAQKTKYMVMIRQWNAGHNHTSMTANKCFQNVANLKYLAKTVTNQIAFTKKLRTN
jgi:hypothetical protein